jgi:hypothetical protein
MLFVQELQQVKSALFGLRNEMQDAVARASEVWQLRGKVEELQKELILMGELQQKYRDSFFQMPLSMCHEEEKAHLWNSFSQEIRGLSQNFCTIRST